uniref:RNA polymerase subunit alpha n=1 Tax=Piridium sociabile TaxID=2570542 RepID=A0A5B9XVR1_9ALVE|nr:RNA polymerase subunit alpha [Piridium sociabile]
MLKLQLIYIDYLKNGLLYLSLYFFCISVRFNFIGFNAIRRTLNMFLYNIKIIAIKTLNNNKICDYNIGITLKGVKDNYFNLLTKIQNLILKIIVPTYFYITKLLVYGPLVVLGYHLQIPNTLKNLTLNKYLTLLSGKSKIELIIIFGLITSITSKNYISSIKFNNISTYLISNNIQNNIFCNYYSFKIITRLVNLNEIIIFGLSQNNLYFLHNFIYSIFNIYNLFNFISI